VYFGGLAADLDLVNKISAQPIAAHITDDRLGIPESNPLRTRPTEANTVPKSTTPLSVPRKDTPLHPEEEAHKIYEHIYIHNLHFKSTMAYRKIPCKNELGGFGLSELVSYVRC